MYTTPKGAIRTLIRRYRKAEILGTYATPAVGDLVALVPKFPLLAPTLVAKKKSSKKAELAPNPDRGKLEPAFAAIGGNPDVTGIIVSKFPTTGDVDSYFVAPPGEPVPLSLFGNLATLQAFGDTNYLWLSSTAKGKVVGDAPIDGSWRRRVARLPKLCSALTATDLDPNHPESIYVELIEEPGLTS